MNPYARGINVKATIKIATVIAVITLTMISISSVSSIGSNEATTDVFWSNSRPGPGETVTVRINFQSNSQNQIQIYAIGIHGDWMQNQPNPVFAGPNYSSRPVTVLSSGSHFTEPITIQIPADISLGTHNYYVGVDGIDSTDTAFSWNSPTATITIETPHGTTAPGATNSKNNNNQAPMGNPNWLVYAAVIAAVAVLVVLIFVVMMRRRRSAPQQTVASPQKHDEQYPGDDFNSGQEQDFNI